MIVYNYILYATTFFNVVFIIFLFVVRLWHIQITRQWLNCKLKKAFMTMGRLVMCCLVRSDSCQCINFLLAFLRTSAFCLSRVSLLSNLKPSNFSHSLFFMLFSLTLILTASLELTNKLHFSELLFNKLLSNHSKFLMLFHWMLLDTIY